MESSIHEAINYVSRVRKQKDTIDSISSCLNSRGTTDLDNASIATLLTLFRMGVVAKRPPPSTSFFSVTSTNIEFDPQNFLTFSFNPFATLVQNFKFAPSASPKLLNLNQDQPSKKAIFLVKSL